MPGMRLTKDHTPLLAGLAVFTAAWLFLFWEHLPQLYDRWQGQDNSYCMLVPLVFAYLVWENRAKLDLTRCGGPIPGYILFVLTGMVYLAGWLGSMETLVYAAMWLSISALLVLLFGLRSLKVLGFPLLVLLFAVPLPPFIIRTLTFRLKLLSSEMAVYMLNLLSVPAFGDGNIIDLGVTRLQVVNACSGLRYLLPSVLMALLLGYFVLGRMWKRLLLIAAAGPVTLVSNAFRIAMTGLLIKHVSEEFGQGFLHDFSGWVVYMLSLVLLAVGAWLLRKIGREGAKSAAKPKPKSKDDLEDEYVILGEYGEEPTSGESEPEPEERCPAPPGPRKISSGAPHVIVAALLLVTVALGGGYMFRAQQPPNRQDFQAFPMAIGDWEGRRSFLSKEILDELWADDYVTGTYTNVKTGNQLHLLVSYYERQTTEHTAHAPTSCLVGSGWGMLEKRVLAPNKVRSFEVAKLLLKIPGRTVISNFWFDQRGRIITSEYLNKLYLVLDSIFMGRSDGALVRVELFVNEGQSQEEAQVLLDAFTAELKAILEPHIPGE